MRAGAVHYEAQVQAAVSGGLKTLLIFWSTVKETENHASSVGLSTLKAHAPGTVRVVDEGVGT